MISITYSKARPNGPYIERRIDKYDLTDLFKDLPDEAKAAERDIPVVSLAHFGVENGNGDLIAWVPHGYSANWYRFDIHKSMWVKKIDI